VFCRGLQCVAEDYSVLQCVVYADIKRDRAATAGSKPADHQEGFRAVT